MSAATWPKKQVGGSGLNSLRNQTNGTRGHQETTGRAGRLPCSRLEKADAALLSEHLRNEMQKFYDELAEKNGSGADKNEK